MEALPLVFSGIICGASKPTFNLAKRGENGGVVQNIEVSVALFSTILEHGSSELLYYLRAYFIISEIRVRYR